MVLKKQNKKAMIFTVITIFLLSLFFLSYSIYYISKERNSVNARISTMNNFVFSLEKDMSRQVYISGYRALVSLESRITANESFLADSRAAIKEAVINGTISQQPVSLMNGYRLQDWNSRVLELGNKINILVSYTIKNVDVSQEDPWHVKLDMEIELFAKDKSNLAYWNKTENISAGIEIIGFEDPFYLINTNG